MARGMTEEQRLQIECNEAMQNFNHFRKREWRIWGAKHQECPICHQPPKRPCINMVDVNKGLSPIACRVNTQPHDDRIDWKRIRDGLRKRGYFRQ